MDTRLPSSSTFLGQSTRMGAASCVTLGSAPLSVIRDCPPPHVAMVGIRVGDAPHTVGPGVGPGGPAELPCGCCPRLHSPNRASPAGGDLGPGIGGRAQRGARWADLDTWLSQSPVTPGSLSWRFLPVLLGQRCSASFTGQGEGVGGDPLGVPLTGAPTGALRTQPLSPASSRLDLAERGPDARGGHLAPDLHLHVRLGRLGRLCPRGRRR